MVDLGVLAKKSRYFRVRFKYDLPKSGVLHNYLPVGAPFSRDTYVNIIRFLHGEGSLEGSPVGELVSAASYLDAPVVMGEVMKWSWSTGTVASILVRSAGEYGLDSPCPRVCFQYLEEGLGIAEQVAREAMGPREGEVGYIAKRLRELIKTTAWGRGLQQWRDPARRKCAICVGELRDSDYVREAEGNIRPMPCCFCVVHVTCFNEWIGGAWVDCPVCTTPYVEGEMDPLDAGDGGWYPALMRNAWRYRYGVDKGAIYPSPSGKRGGVHFEIKSA